MEKLPLATAFFPVEMVFTVSIDTSAWSTDVVPEGLRVRLRLDTCLFYKSGARQSDIDRRPLVSMGLLAKKSHSLIFASNYSWTSLIHFVPTIHLL